MRLPRSSLSAKAVAVLREPLPARKVSLTREASALWYSGKLSSSDPTVFMPMRPARPAEPTLLAPRHMPQRRLGGLRGRIALLHAVAHIELNAIDLAWDLIGRFGSAFDWPEDFFHDWVSVAVDEARHLSLLEERLSELGAAYGDLPAHDGLWQAAVETAHDPLARLSVVPMVLEARGLDVTPAMINRLRRAGDGKSADLLETILNEEIAHVAAGSRWFFHLCRYHKLPEVETWRALVGKHYSGELKPPFNERARSAAGMLPGLYL
ncbi:MAG: rhamnosyltransferase [Rhodospirillaceae bacterium]|nr:rhamnosyltransferase [Rhodospirillaceae bacterium]